MREKRRKYHNNINYQIVAPDTKIGKYVMKYKLFTLLLVIVANVCTLFAADYENIPINGLYYNLNTSNQEAIVTYFGYGMTSGYNFNCDDITIINIPASISYNNLSYRVTGIDGHAFHNCHNLTSVSIPNGVTHIGMYAFCDCYSLTSIAIPNSVTYLGSSAFEGCTALSSVYIDDIGKWCSIDFTGGPSNPLYYAHNLYLNGELVTDVVLPDSVIIIESQAFYYCTSLTSINIPIGVTSIGHGAFNGCTNLTIVNIPTTVTTIGNSAFRDCVSLTSCQIPSGVRSIGNSAFYNCCSLTAVSLPYSLTSIRPELFYGCTSLNTVEIPASVSEIYDYAFANCTSLSRIYNYSLTPQVVNDLNKHLFQDVNISMCQLIVPQQSISLYQTANCWKNFYQILSIEGTSTAIDQISYHPNTNSQKLVKDGQIFILRGDKTYTTDGRLVR